VIGSKSSGLPLLTREFRFCLHLWGKLEFTPDVQQEGLIEFYPFRVGKKFGLLRGRLLAVCRHDSFQSTAVRRAATKATVFPDLGLEGPKANDQLSGSGQEGIDTPRT